MPAQTGEQSDGQWQKCTTIPSHLSCFTRPGNLFLPISLHLTPTLINFPSKINYNRILCKCLRLLSYYYIHSHFQKCPSYQEMVKRKFKCLKDSLSSPSHCWSSSSSLLASMAGSWSRHWVFSSSVLYRMISIQSCAFFKPRNFFSSLMTYWGILIICCSTRAEMIKQWTVVLGFQLVSEGSLIFHTVCFHLNTENSSTMPSQV